jgi:hypothetical protein
MTTDSEHVIIIDGIVSGISNEDINKKMQEEKEKRKEIIKKAARNIIIIIIISFLAYLLFN